MNFYAVNQTNAPVSFTAALALVLLILNSLGCVTRNEYSNSKDQSSTASSNIIQIVQGLGRDDNRQHLRCVEDLKELAQSPVAAMDLLIRELKPVDLIRLDYEGNNPASITEGRHVMWCLRAIYFLTGEKFCATTQYKFKDSELDQNRVGLIYDYDQPRKVRFFVEWMSRGTVYFAPTDAQIKIISQWRSWFERQGKTHPYRKDAKLNDWYFG